MLRMTVAAAAVLGHATVATACSCARQSIEELIEDPRDLVVVSARVVSVLSPGDGKPAVTRLQIREILKGEAPKVIEMTGVTAADHPCGIDFRPGEVRTLAAYRKDGGWFTDMCLVPRL